MKGSGRAIGVASGAVLCVLVVLLAGCSSNSHVAAGAIVVSIAGGSTTQQQTSLGVSQQATLSMSPVNDALGAGVDWTIACGGSPVTGSISGGACGTISPAHTPSGAPTIYTAPAYVPIGKTVTITASATSNPSATSSITFTIAAPALSIGFSSTPVTSLQVGQQTFLTVVVKNDTANAGATWSVKCADSPPAACGTLNTDQGLTNTYTAPNAPPSGPVTITATSVTDPTVSVSTDVTITPAPQVSVRVSPTAFSVGAALSGETASLVANVDNDSTNAGVDWKVSCVSVLGNCGSVSPPNSASGVPVTYTAPPTVPSGGTVTITATAKATESSSQPISATSVATVTTAQTPSVSVNAPQSLAESTSTGLTASVSNDPSNAGVTWSVSCSSSGACGSITDATGSDGTYTATYTAPDAIPAGGLVTISAAPKAISPAGNPGLASINITATPPSVTFLQLPPSSVTAGAKVPISAAVANDTTAGGVVWSVQCADPNSPWSCGSVAPYQTASGVSAVFTAPPVPPSGPVSIMAAAAATCSGTSCDIVTSATVNIQPSTVMSINFVPVAPTQLLAASSGYLTVAVTNDSSSQGVDWQVCASGCGFFTLVPEIPAPPQSPNSLPTPAVTATQATGWPNGLPILYTAPADVPASGTVAIQASAHANNLVSTVAAVSISTNGAGPALNGSVMAGNLAVSGAQVALYAAGTSGYGSAATLVSPPGQSGFATTDSSGNFTIPAGYSCPQSSSQMFLVALDGKPGNATDQNPSLALMTALGTCGTLSSTTVVINEVTSVGSVWALAPFAANPLKTGLNPYGNIGTSSGNTSGLANAFASVNNLVDISTGQPRFEVPAANASVPYAEINALADILNTCVNSPGGQAGDGSACGALFTFANPYRAFIGQTLYSGIPTDTLQAAFEIAQNPDYSGNGPSTVIASIDGRDLYSVVSPASPFQPIPGDIPYDFSLSLNFSGAAASATAGAWNSMALDSSGNVWIGDTAANTVREWNNQGVAKTLGAGYTTASLMAPGPIAIDSSGYTWICGQNGLTVLNFVGQELEGSPFAGGGLTATGCNGLAMDGTGNVWATNADSISKFDLYGNPLSPAGGYTIPTSPKDSTMVNLAGPIAIDSSGNVWVGVLTSVYNGALSLAELDNANVVPNYLSPQPSSGTPSNFVNSGGYPSELQIAIDGSGNVWGGATQPSCVPGSLFKVPAYKGLGTTDTASAVPGNIGAIDPFRCSSGVAIDGAGMVWAASLGGPADPLVTPPNLGGYNPALSSDTFGFASSSLANGPRSVAIDGSGNTWVLLENNTVTEFIGVATPGVTPISVAVKQKKLGAKP